MKQLELVRLLLHKAAQDEAVLAALVGDPKFDNETVGFHAQQAVEKLLKAWLAFLGEDFPKVHRLETLLDLLAQCGKALPHELAEVTRLTPFGTDFVTRIYRWRRRSTERACCPWCAMCGRSSSSKSRRTSLDQVLVRACA
jgi:hypothetical protein